MTADERAEGKWGGKICPNCNGPIAIRNPTGKCDHLYWPEYLTDDARALVRSFAEAQRKSVRVIANAPLTPS